MLQEPSLLNEVKQRLWSIMQMLKIPKAKNHQNVGINKSTFFTENECNKTEEQYSSKGEKFQILNFVIHIKRKAGFQLKILIIPSALLPLLTGCMFWIPPGRPDRLGIGMLQLSFLVTRFGFRVFSKIFS